MQHILDALVPLPASVLNERFDLLAWHAAYEVLWPTVVGREPCERNVLWLNFLHAECCHPYVNRDEQLSTLVAQLRAAYGHCLDRLPGGQDDHPLDADIAAAEQLIDDWA